MPKRANRDNGSAREHILAVGARLFAEKGYDAASMREVAEAAKVAKPTVYYYFSSKEGLFEALLKAGVDSLCGELRAINARPADAGAERCIEDAVRACFRFAEEHGDLNRFIHSLAFSPMQQRERRAVEREFLKVNAQFLEVLGRAAREGLLDAGRIPSATLALRGALMANIVDSLHGKSEIRPESAAEIVAGFLYGYAPRESEKKESERR